MSHLTVPGHKFRRCTNEGNQLQKMYVNINHAHSSIETLAFALLDLKGWVTQMAKKKKKVFILGISYAGSLGFICPDNLPPPQYKDMNGISFVVVTVLKITMKKKINSNMYFQNQCALLL